MTTQELKTMLSDGTFHHATYRSFGSIWEGLWIYKKDKDGFGGFSPAGSFSKNDPQLPQAEELTRRTSVSVGSYGQG
jgi:hypothetical protein